MSLQELETVVANLPQEQLAKFASWFDEYRADLWDRQVEQDIAAGKLDKLGSEIDDKFDRSRSMS